MPDMRLRLLESLPRSMFDRSPDSALALRVRNPAGLSWSVSDGLLRVVAGGAEPREYQLDNRSVAELADALRLDGHDVVFESSELGGRSALALLAASGDQDGTNGDHLLASTSPLWAILGAYGWELEAASDQILQVLQQLVMGTADPEWLDVWTEQYGLSRLKRRANSLFMDDEVSYDGTMFYDGVLYGPAPVYYADIVSEVLRLRSTPLAIEQAVLDVANEDVTIDEPWKRLFIVGESVLSGDHLIHDGEFFTYHVIQPVLGEGTDFAAIMPVVARNKAGGVLVADPRYYFPPFVVDAIDGVFSIRDGRSDERGSWLTSPSSHVIGLLRLSDAEPETTNHLLAQARWWFVEQEATDGDLGFRLHNEIPKRREVAYASVCLSDGVPLGDPNCVLGRGLDLVDPAPAMTLSETAALSTARMGFISERVERITVSTHSSGLLGSLVFPPIGFLATEELAGG